MNSLKGNYCDTWLLIPESLSEKNLYLEFLPYILLTNQYTRFLKVVYLKNEFMYDIDFLYIINKTIRLVWHSYVESKILQNCKSGIYLKDRYRQVHDRFMVSIFQVFLQLDLSQLKLEYLNHQYSFKNSGTKVINWWHGLLRKKKIIYDTKWIQQLTLKMVRGAPIYAPTAPIY